MSVFALLADGDNNFGDLLVFVAFIVLTVIAAIVQKASRKAEQKRAEEQYGRRRAEREAAERRGGAQPAQRRQAAPPVQRYREAQPMQQPQRPPVRVMPPPVPAQRRRPAVMPRRPAQARGEPHRVVELIAEPLPAESTPRRGLSVAAAVEPMARPSEATPAGVQLRSREALRQAIIYHEVFSLPKALRATPEPWEL